MKLYVALIALSFFQIMSGFLPLKVPDDNSDHLIFKREYSSFVPMKKKIEKLQGSEVKNLSPKGKVSNTIIKNINESIEFIEFKGFTSNLKSFSLPSINNKILLPDETARSGFFKEINKVIPSSEIIMSYDRYKDLYQLKYFKPFISQINKTNISIYSQNQEERLTQNWRSSVFAQYFIRRSASKHLTRELNSKYFCDNSKNDCSLNKAYYGNIWGGDDRNKFRELDLYTQYINSGILEETQKWADDLFAIDQTYLVVMPIKISDNYYDFQKNILPVSLNLPFQFFDAVKFKNKIETEGFTLNFPSEFHFNHQLIVPIKMSPDKAENFFKKYSDVGGRVNSRSGMMISGFAFFKIKFEYKETVQDLSLSNYNPVINAQLKLMSPMVSIFKDLLMQEEIAQIDLTTAIIR